MGLFGFKKTQDKSKDTYQLLKVKLGEIQIHSTEIIKEIETSTFENKLIEYNNEMLQFLENLQIFENFFIHNKQVNKINVVSKFLDSRHRSQFVIKKDKNTKKNLEQRTKELIQLKQEIELANKMDLELNK